MAMSDVLFSAEPPLAFVTFNRPEARNALTWTMYQGLLDACDTVDGRADLRVLIVRGAGGKAFAAGTDISQFTSFRSEQDGIDYERRLDAAIDRLERVSKVTIAQVQGVATGGGCAIALTCDLRVCSPDARFGIPIAKTLGNCLSIANSARLMDLLGPARFKDLMITARLMDVQEATLLGLVTRVGADRIDEATRELATTVAAHAPLTISVTKEMVRRIQEARRPSQGAGEDLVGRCYASADFKEGVAAFLAKRAPVWTGS
jgi:enoyl-CoA hydratase